jgi:hypothetical protein
MNDLCERAGIALLSCLFAIPLVSCLLIHFRGYGIHLDGYLR